MNVKNPKTGRLIKVGGPTWNALTPSQQKQALGKSPSSPKKASPKSPRSPNSPKKTSPRSPPKSSGSPPNSPLSFLSALPFANPSKSPKKARTTQQQAWDKYQKENPEEYKKYVYLAQLGLDMPVMQEIKLNPAAKKVQNLYEKILNSGVNWERFFKSEYSRFFTHQYIWGGNLWTLTLKVDASVSKSDTPNYNKVEYLSLNHRGYLEEKTIMWNIPENSFVKDIKSRHIKLTEASFNREIDKELSLMMGL